MAEAQGEIDPRVEPEQGERKHVFVANHSPDFLGLMRELLQDERYNVTTTTLAARTFEQIAGLLPDLLVADLKVGDRAGWELLDRLHAEATTSGIPIVVVSTDPRLLDAARGLAHRPGGRRFVAKPLDLEDLVATIRELIGTA